MNEETIYTDEQQTAGQQPTASSEPTEGQQKSNSTKTWKTITLGGITGIALGTAAGYALNANAADAANLADSPADAATPAADGGQPGSAQPVEAMDVAVAQVDQNLSFGQAFAEARQQVGAGGVFAWHGQLYGTYYADEWQAMSDAERNSFAAGAAPHTSLAAATRPHVTYTETHTETHTETETVTTVGGGGGGGDNARHTADDGDEPEVHFLGVESIEREDGTINVGLMQVNDVNVALVDVDNDRVFDVRWTDVNDNGDIESNEVTDISDRGLSVDTFQAISEAEREAQLEQAATQQDDLAPDMPDYMNDANVGMI